MIHEVPSNLKHRILHVTFKYLKTKRILVMYADSNEEDSIAFATQLFPSIRSDSRQGSTGSDDNINETVSLYVAYQTTSLQFVHLLQ